MSRAVFAAGSRLFWLALRRKFNVARGRVLVWPLAGLIYWPTRGERLVIAPQELRTADPTRANEIYGGGVVVAGKIVFLDGPSAFESEAPARAGSRQFAGGWWLCPRPVAKQT